MNEAENDTPGLVRLSDGLGLAEEARACARHCKEGAWSPNVLQNEQGVRLKSAQVLEAAATEIERLRATLAAIDKHSVSTLRTNSKDRGDWAEDVAFMGKLARGD